MKGKAAKGMAPKGTAARRTATQGTAGKPRAAEPGTHVALFRGINVGTAKRVSMGDLRALAEGLGFTGARTLLNSGNLVFTAKGRSAGGAAARLEEALAARCGISARVTVVSAAELAAAVAGNPLVTRASDPSRLLVWFSGKPADLARLQPLAARGWEPDALALGGRVAYGWCPAGVLESPLAKAAGKALGDSVTARNWATVLKLHALLGGAP